MTPADLDAVLTAARGTDGAFAEVFDESGHRLHVEVSSDGTRRVRSARTAGASLRVLRGRDALIASTEDLSARGLDALVRGMPDYPAPAHHAVEMARGRAEMGAANPVRPAEVSRPHQAIVEALVAGYDAARTVSSSVEMVALEYVETDRTVRVATSDGVRASDRRLLRRLLVQVTARDASSTQTIAEHHGVLGQGDLVDPVDIGDRATAAARRAVGLLRAAPSPVGVMPVVLASGAGGVLFHEACGHGLEADSIGRRRSIFGGRLGERVAHPAVSAVDDGSLPGAFGSGCVDDEGMTTGPTPLIERGVLVGYLVDRQHGAELRVRATGNGRRQSHRHSPLPRMTNTFICAGEMTPDEVIRRTQRGLFAMELGGGQVDVSTGNFVFAVTLGRRIQNGRLGRPVRGATIIGNGPAALGTIDLVANDLEFRSGMCTKAGQSVPVCVGQPTVRVAELMVAG